MRDVERLLEGPDAILPRSVTKMTNIARAIVMQRIAADHFIQAKYSGDQ